MSGLFHLPTFSVGFYIRLHLSSSMGTDAHTPSSDEETPEWEDWDSFSENDKMKKQEKVTEYLTKRTTIEKFGEECKNIGQTAVAIDRDFRQVKTGLANLVKKYGGDFPGIEKVHLPKWIKLKAVSYFFHLFSHWNNLRAC